MKLFDCANDNLSLLSRADVLKIWNLRKSYIFHKGQGNSYLFGIHCVKKKKTTFRSKLRQTMRGFSAHILQHFLFMVIFMKYVTWILAFRCILTFDWITKCQLQWKLKSWNICHWNSPKFCLTQFVNAPQITLQNKVPLFQSDKLPTLIFLAFSPHAQKFDLISFQMWPRLFFKWNSEKIIPETTRDITHVQPLTLFQRIMHEQRQENR